MAKTTVSQRAQRDKRQGKAASTQAGEFVRDEIKRIRRGEHGARSTKQAIAIGLSRARRAGVDLPPPSPERATEDTVEHAKRDYRKGQTQPAAKADPKRSRAVLMALKREGTEAASSESLARQARQQARMRTAKERSMIGRKAAKTRMAHQSHAQRVEIARKAARTRRINQGRHQAR